MEAPRCRHEALATPADGAKHGCARALSLPQALDSRGYWIVLDGGAVPSPFGARHVRGTVVNVPDTPPWRGAAATLSYCSAGGELFPVRLEGALLKSSLGSCHGALDLRLARTFDSKLHCCRAMLWQLRRLHCKSSDPQLASPGQQI